MSDVTVIIASYNSAHLVTRAIDSILRQSVAAKEILVVDDGSTDDTEVVVRRYGAPVRYLQRRNGGCAAARNTGIDAAVTTWIAFLDADDWWAPEKLERQLALAQERPECGLIYCDALVVDEHGNTLGHYLADKKPADGWIFEDLLTSHFVLPSTMLIRRELTLAAGRFTDYMRMVDDCDFCTRLARIAPFAWVPEPLMIYQRQPNSMTRNHARNSEYEVLLMRKLLAMPLTPPQRSKVKARMGRRLAEIAYHYRRTAPKKALDAGLELLRSQGGSVQAWKLFVLATLSYLTSDEIA
jgi:glycosyltransferase involved in cell wall biosynthesis